MAFLSPLILLALGGTAGADEAVDPVVEEITETVTQTVDPAVEAVDPVVEEITETVTETVDPVVEAVDPVVEDTKRDVDAAVGSETPAVPNRSSAGTVLGRPTSGALGGPSDRLRLDRGRTTGDGVLTASGSTTTMTSASAEATADAGTRSLAGDGSDATRGTPFGRTDTGITLPVLGLFAILILTVRLFLPSIRSSLAPSAAAWNAADLALSVERPG